MAISKWHQRQHDKNSILSSNYKRFKLQKPEVEMLATEENSKG